MSTPRISVFTPTYNRAGYLPNAFNSLQKSTFQDFEWVIADDGSADNTAQVVQEFQKTAGFEIVYLPFEHGGKMRTMNAGVAHCRGEYFFELDSDDEILPRALEQALQVWDQLEDPADICGVVGRCVLPDGTVIGDRIDERVNQLEGKELSLYLFQVRAIPCSSLMRTEIIKSYPFPLPAELDFVPEAVVWRKMHLKFRDYYTNLPFLAYHLRADMASFSAQRKPDPRPTYFYYTYFFNEIYPYDPHVGFIEYGVSAASLCHAAIRCGHSLRKTLSDLQPLKARVLCVFGWPVMWLVHQYQTRIQKKEL